MRDPEFQYAKPSEAECVNFCILTSDAFEKLVWQPIYKHCRADYPFLDSVKLKHVAQMIIGMAPGDEPERRFQGDIINGPMDVDKLDYLTRDGYFTGVNLSVDIDRLLPSLHAAFVDDVERQRREKRLVVAQRGIAVCRAASIRPDVAVRHGLSPSQGPCGKRGAASNPENAS